MISLIIFNINTERIDTCNLILEDNSYEIINIDNLKNYYKKLKMEYKLNNKEGD